MGMDKRMDLAAIVGCLTFFVVSGIYRVRVTVGIISSLACLMVLPWLNYGGWGGRNQVAKQGVSHPVMCIEIYALCNA